MNHVSQILSNLDASNILTALKMVTLKLLQEQPWNLYLIKTSLIGLNEIQY